jgi:hypothetical protein
MTRTLTALSSTTTIGALLTLCVALAGPALANPPAAPAAAQPVAAPAAPKPACTGPEHRQFDFWLGAWDVKNPAGKLVGTNEITSELGGCVLQEHWKGMGGSMGMSFNIYDASDRTWHQIWVDGSGSLLNLAGAFSEGKMILSGTTRGAGDAVTQERITWTPQDGGRVRQLWEQSKDGGATWTVAFDGTYQKRAGA